MGKKYRVGIIGVAHMHINNVAAIYAQHPQVEMVACADTVPIKPELREAPYTRAWNLRNLVENLHIPKVYEDYHKMLKEQKMDIVICCSENAMHPEIVESCAASGVNVCVEKPMAMSLSHGLRMVRACKAFGTEMIVNWPATWSPSTRKAKALIDEGVVGRVLQVKWRGGHTGPLGPGAAHAGVNETAAPMTGQERAATWWHQVSTGGGGMLDFCCYGSMISRWYIGKPAVAVVGMKANLDSHWSEADDNGAMIVRFPDAMAIVEGTWTTWDHGVTGGPIVYGTTGTLVVESREGKPVVRLERGHGKTTIYDSQPLPEGRQNVAEEFIHHLETKEPLHITLDMMFNLEAMAILDAGYRSASTGKMETVDNVSWCIG